MRDKMIYALPIFGERRPEFAKGWFIFDVLPFDAVNVSEVKSRTRRANQGVRFGNDLVVLHTNERDRTGTVGVKISSLKIYRNKAHVPILHRQHHAPDQLPLFHLVQNLIDLRQCRGFVVTMNTAFGGEFQHFLQVLARANGRSHNAIFAR